MTRTQAARARWAVAAMFATNGLVMGAWATQIPLLLPRHAIDEATLGLLIVVLGVGAVASMLFTGRLIARLGSVRVLRWFALSASVALPLVVFSPSLTTLAAAMALMGSLIGSMDVAMNANAVEVERRLGRAILSSSHGFWSLGGFFGASLGAAIVGNWGAGPQALIVGAVSLAVVLIALPYVRGEPALADPSQASVPVALVPRHAALWVLGMMALLSMVSEGAVLDWAALFLRQDLGADLFAAGLAFACFSAAMAAMRFAGDGVRNRFGAVNTLRASGLLAAAGMCVAATAPTDTVAIGGFFLVGLGAANMVPILLSAAGNFSGLPPAVAISTVAMLGYAGILVAPASIGFVAAGIGFRWTFGALALLLLLVAVLAGRTRAADGARPLPKGLA